MTQSESNGHESETTRRPQRQRPGWFRRWLVRPVMWGIALLAVLVWGLHVFLQSQWVGEYFGRKAETGLGELLDRHVEVDALHLRLLPLGLEVRGLVIGGDDANDPPMLEVGRLLVDIELVDLQRRVLTIQQVVIEEPRFYVEIRGPGDNNLPRFARRERRGPKLQVPLRVNIRRLAVAGGQLHLQQQKIPLDLLALAVNADVTGTSATDLTGRLVAGSVQVQLPRANPIIGSVAVRVALDSEGLRVLNGRLGAEDLAATATGRVSWKEKTWIFEVAGRGDMAFVHRMGFLADEVSGAVEFEGGFAWSERSWGFRAQASSPSMTVLDRTIDDVRTVVSGDRNGVRFDVEQARYAGGSIGGGLSIDSAADPNSFEADLRLDRIDLQQLIDDQGIPVEDRLAGLVSGVFDYRFPFGQAQRGQGWANLSIAAPPDVGSDRIPVEGSASIIIEQGSIRTRAARLIGPFQRLEADGVYDIARRSGEFSFEIQSARVERLVPLLPFEDTDPQLWLPTAGQGTFDGILEVSPRGVETRVRIDLSDFVAPGGAAERLQGTMSLSRAGMEELRLELLDADAGLILTGSVPFDGDPGADREIPFELSIDAAGWPLAQARPWLPFEVPVEGRLYGSLQIWGRPDDPTGSLRVTARDATVMDRAVDRVELRMDFDSDWLTIDQLQLLVPAGSATVRGTMNRRSGDVDLEVVARELEMDREPFAALAPGGLTGRLEVFATIVGPAESPGIEASMHWTDLALGAEPLGVDGEAGIELGLHDQVLELQGDLLGLIQVRGGGSVADSRVDLRVGIDSEMVGELLQMAGVDAALEGGSLGGDLFIRGDLASPASWKTRLELQRLDIVYQGRHLSNLEAVAIDIGLEVLEIESLFLGESDTDNEAFLAGRIFLQPEPRLDLRIQTSLGSNWLELVLPEIGLQAGQMELLAVVTGPPEAPVVNGQARIINGRLLIPGQPFSITDLRGTILFYPDQVVIEDFRAGAAGGELRASGSTGPLSWSEPVEYRIRLSAADVELPFPEDWRSRGSADLTVTSTAGGRQVRGTVDLEQALFVQDVRLSLTQMLSGVFGRERVEVDRAGDLASTTELNITIRGEDALRVRNNLADLRGDMDLLVRGSLGDPVIFGKVEVDRGGTLRFGSNTYSVDRGRLSFTNPYRIEPVVDLVAAADVREFDITLNLTGPIDKLNATFTSNPPLADLEILSLLSSGGQSWTSGVERPSSSESEAQLRATSLLYGQAASLVSQRAGRLFGLDRFRLQPPTSSSGELSSARVTIGKQLSRDLFATYSYDPSTTEEQVIQLEWSVTREMMLVLTQNGDESYAVDVRWEKSF